MDIKEVDQALLTDERNHWWICTRFLYVDKAISVADRAEPLSVGEFGCGTGQNLWYLRQQSPHRARIGRLIGVDPHLPADWHDAPGATGIELLRSLPDRGESFDVILAMDVLEHLDDDAGALAEWLTYLVPSGIVLLTVPAFNFLWSGHDEFLEHRRRYRRGELDRLASRCGLVRVKSCYAFSYLLLPALFLRKLVRRGRVASDLRVPNGFVNATMKLAGRAEAALGGCRCCGTSVVGIYRKPG